MYSVQKNGVSLPNSPQGPVWAYTGPETRSLVRSRPEGSFCSVFEPQHLAQCLGYNEYSINTCSWISGWINSLLEGIAKQKRGSLWIFTVNHRQLTLMWIHNPRILLCLSVMFGSCVFISYYLRHVILTVMKDVHRWQKSREKRWRRCEFPLPAVPVLDEVNSAAILWSFLQKSSSDWPTEAESVVKQRGSAGWPLSSRAGAHLLRLKARGAEIKSQRTLSVRDQMVNSLGFVGLVGSVATTRLCYCSAKQP